MSIQISITPDGTATLHGEGTEPETLVAATYADAQAQAIDKLIARAKAAGEPLHAITDETPPTTLRIEPSGTVTPVPAAEAPPQLTSPGRSRARAAQRSAGRTSAGRGEASRTRAASGAHSPAGRSSAGRDRHTGPIAA